MKTVHLILALLLSISCCAQNWIQKAPIPSHIGVIAPNYFTINDKLYVGGGYTGTQSVKTFFEYDPTTDIWTPKADMPDSIYSACVFALNGKGYVVCGANPNITNHVYAYDPVSNTWQTKNNFPGGARQNLSGFSLKGKGYLGGGFIGGNSCSNEMWQYNDTTDAWTQMASIPGPGRNGIFPFIINDLAYVGLGSNTNGTVWYSDLYRFNPDSNTYTQVASFPTPVGGAVFFTIGQTGYVGLGHTGTGTPNKIYQYSAATDTWTLADTFNGGSRFVSFCGVLAGKPYIGCGTDSLGNYYYDNWTWSCSAFTITQSGDSLFASQASDYQWYLNGSPISGATHSYYVPTASGSYTVVTTDNNSCNRVTAKYGYTTTSIGDHSNSGLIQVSPNPANEYFILNVNSQALGSALIFSDLTGRVITSGKIDQEQSRYDIHDLSAGVYLLRIGTKSYMVVKQ